MAAVNSYISMELEKHESRMVYLKSAIGSVKSIRFSSFGEMKNNKELRDILKERLPMNIQEYFNSEELISISMTYPLLFKNSIDIIMDETDKTIKMLGIEYSKKESDPSERKYFDILDSIKNSVVEKYIDDIPEEVINFINKELKSVEMKNFVKNNPVLVYKDVTSPYTRTGTFTPKKPRKLISRPNATGYIVKKKPYDSKNIKIVNSLIEIYYYYIDNDNAEKGSIYFKASDVISKYEDKLFNIKQIEDFGDDIDAELIGELWFYLETGFFQILESLREEYPITKGDIESFLEHKDLSISDVIKENEAIYNPDHDKGVEVSFFRIINTFIQIETEDANFTLIPVGSLIMGETDIKIRYIYKESRNARLKTVIKTLKDSKYFKIEVIKQGAFKFLCSAQFEDSESRLIEIQEIEKESWVYYNLFNGNDEDIEYITNVMENNNDYIFNEYGVYDKEYKNITSEFNSQNSIENLEDLKTFFS